ncbi:conserved hypothetical protein [Theileria equi strain WA]|uniref:Signal peptide containing protein n=1 Tax=Theileria equi strain WA TaxID=1537102 RepID=L1LB24_THEEQ|nr:conserved hypothetical protein [Theileria equi strain WA]EKX72343.1 conserved hypothetical protein [Theileria equi strain WA]|eukprot:XP_004831795.1 conserved hypothetical protein [Theileria equi strain WA]
MLHSLVSGIVACYSQMYIAHAIGRTVDIASPELISACKSAPTDCKEIQQHLCIMSHSFSITRVLNSGNLIWESQSHGEACIYYTVYQFYGQNYLGYLKIRNGLFSHYVHYRINGEEWREIAFEEYVLTFSRMRTERIFDVGFPEDHIVRTTEYTPFGTPAFIYNPYETYKIVKVQDGIVNIWESNSACVNCEYVVVHKARGEPRMVHMFVKDGDTYDILYFDRIGTKWIGIQKADFYAKLGELDGEITRL